MDPKLMAEFVRQEVMNANNLAGQDPEQKRNQTKKHATIAQIIQSQQRLQSTIARNTREDKLFVYDQFPDVNITQANGNVKPYLNTSAAAAAAISNFQLPVLQSTRHTSSIGPIRNIYGRVLRPGIDNFGLSETVANPGHNMQDTELLRQRTKKKRGPKEKEMFSIFMYCLPHRNSKLPMYSILDPTEMALVDQHQQEGFGYPSQDYFHGIPRKTQLCLSLSDKEFQAYMVALYPKLKGRLYDMYRRDRSRRLIRVEAHSPRQIKDMNYSGSLIVIPYDTAEDRPAAVIQIYVCHSNSSPSLGNPLAKMQNFTIPLTSMPELVPETVADTKPKMDTERELPIFPGQPLPLTTGQNGKTEVNGNCSPNPPMETDNEYSNEHSNFEDAKVLQIVQDMRNSIQDTKDILLRPDALFIDLLNVYRNDPTLEKHNISVCFQTSHNHENVCSEHDDDHTEPGTMFAMFWEEAFRKHFTGTYHLVPIINPSSANDVFKICGRILVHGLVLVNYFPVRFSPACMAALVTESCSDQLALTSFYQVMSESEKDVLDIAIAELKSGAGSYSAKIERCMKIILGCYGFEHIPELSELDAAMTSIAKTFLLYWPHLSLCQLRAGVVAAGFKLEEVREDDIIQLYQILTPSVPSILERVHYNKHDEAPFTNSEERAKFFFEQFLLKIPRLSLHKLLEQWCGLDCLSVRKLTVKFTDKESVSLFAPKDRTLHLPINFPAMNVESKNTWGYTL